mmetsp:Transcript_156/g.222  ORF Transcript_156/g.222 Transcript_156/m.222 type:complete len:129 (+) Transcript_156:2-388(+)
MEEKVGSPEKPLSDMGAASYRNFWSTVLVNFLCNYKRETLSIMDIAKETSFMTDDIVSTLKSLKLIYLDEVKGEHVFVKNKSLLQKLAYKFPLKEPQLDVSKIHWVPYIDGKKDKYCFRNLNQTKRNA